ncbi:unnamed protein product, partial [Owenia fusiformis]
MIVGCAVKCKAFPKYKATIKCITDEEDDANTLLDKQRKMFEDEIGQLIEGIQHPRGAKKRSTEEYAELATTSTSEIENEDISEIQPVKRRKTRKRKNASKIKKPLKDDKVTKVKLSQLNNIELVHKRSKERSEKFATLFATNLNAKVQEVSTPISRQSSPVFSSPVAIRKARMSTSTHTVVEVTQITECNNPTNNTSLNVRNDKENQLSGLNISGNLIELIDDMATNMETNPSSGYQ